jgi:hypothetical protein
MSVAKQFEAIQISNLLSLAQNSHPVSFLKFRTRVGEVAFARYQIIFVQVFVG